MIAIFQSLEHLNTAIPLPPAIVTLENGIEVISKSMRILPSGTQLMEGVMGADGRIAISHAYSKEDIDALQSIEGIIISENLPEDWQYPMK